jgi:CheY-specific phosphatase CheX
MKQLLKNIDDTLKKFRGINQRQKAVFYFQAGVGIFLAFLLIGLVSIKSPKHSTSVMGRIKTVSAKETGDSKSEGNGFLLGDDVDQKSYVAKIESQYYAVVDKNQNLEQKVNDLSSQLERLTNSQEQITNNIATLDTKLSDEVSKAIQNTKVQTTSGVNTQDYQLQITKIADVDTENKKAVYLPAGSFVRGTLLTGVYAPSQQSNPLPVLIRLKEAFYGPNNTRIPLEGAFAIGKATGDLTSERALVQITTLSAVLPSGQSFEQKGNLGYLTDIGGQLGLKGIVVRNTGSQLALSFMSGFMGGASQALADSQTTAVVGENGQISRNVTGSTATNAEFSGLANSASKLSEYYNKQLEEIIPAVKVDAGVEVYFIMLEGVKVNGLTTDGSNSFNYID